MSVFDNKFIFSSDRGRRLTRHVAFWVAWWVFFSIIYGTRPLNHIAFDWSYTIKGYYSSALEAFLFMPPHMLFSYLLIYLLIPRLLLREKYGHFVISLFILMLFCSVVSFQITYYLILPLRRSMNLPTPSDSFYYGLMAGLRGGLQVGGFAAMITLMKHFALKERKNQQLEREKLKAELQLLKAQVHPHFLFNTLNNLYSLALLKSDYAPEVVLQLSALLRYMLYECNAPSVPLDREVQMLQHYVALEKYRYGDRLDISVNVRGDLSGKKIAPLLLLPFLENSFKHGASEQLDQAWISLDLIVKDSSLKMKLINGVNELAQPPGAATGFHGIGLQNVRKRLSLLYPGQHELKIIPTDETFMVSLTVELDDAAQTESVSAQPALSYEL